MRAAIAGMVATALLAGCATTTGGTGRGTSAPTPSAPATARSLPSLPSISTVPSTPISSAPVSVPVSAPVSSPAASGSSTPADVARVLLIPSDIHHGFQSSSDSSSPDGPLPCTPNDPPVDQQVPPSEKGSAEFVKPSARLQINEEIDVYSGVPDARRAQRITEHGLACSHGTVSGVAIDIQGPTDISSVLTPHLDKAEAWAIKSGKITGTLVLVRIHAVLVEFAFEADNNPNVKIDAKQILETALAKIINGG
jgi:hypothetical protein